MADKIPGIKADQKKSQNRAPGRGDRIEQALADYQRAQAVETKISRSANPLEIPELRQRLLRYATVWMTLPDTRDRFFRSDDIEYRNVCGCMVCGSEDVGVIVVDDKAIELGDRWSNWAQATTANDMEWANKLLYWDGAHRFPRPPHIQTLYQLLWRLRPVDYFAQIRPIPLINEPVLIVCKNCAQIFAESHRWVGVPHDASGAKKPGEVKQDGAD
jgi:hypothetical protein